MAKTFTKLVIYMICILTRINSNRQAIPDVKLSNELKLYLRSNWAIEAEILYYIVRLEKAARLAALM